jgi:5-methylthioadenosine/S-adenosylhomocysteine deaminase
MTDRYLAEYLIPMDEAFSIYAPGFVDVADGVVAAAGDASAAPPLPEARVHRLGGVLMPGLVNGHAHSAMTVLRGAGEGLPLDRWLTEVIWPREARMSPEDARAGMIVGAAEMLLAGVTTTNEMYFFAESVAEGARSAGIRSIVSVAIIEAPGVERFGTPEEAMGSAVTLRDRYAGDDLVEIGLGPHSAYALGDEALRAVADAALAEDMLLHIHLAETRTEGDAVAERTGKTVPQHLADLGVFEGRASAAHCVWLSDADVALLADRSVGVAHCPGSNGKLASGIAPVAPMRRAGIAVGAATDGPASNNDLDLWEEARLALLYARLREGDAAVLGVEDALRMATSEAATAVGRDDLGALTPGRRADMIRISLEHVAYDPVHSPADVVSHLVWAGSARDVTDVWVGGVQVVADRVVLTIDLERTRHDLRAAARRIAG